MTNLKNVSTKIRFWDAIILSTPFISGLFIESSFGIVFLFVILLMLYLLVMGIKRKIYLNKKILLFILTISIISFLYNAIFKLNYINSVITILLISVCLIGYYSYIRDNDFDLALIFQKYVKISVFFCCLALLQELLYLTGFDYQNLFPNLRFKEYGYFIGVPSASVEPAYFAIALMPVAYYSVYYILIKRIISINYVLIILTMFFTFSALGYIGLIFSLLLIVFKLFRKNMYILIFTIPFVFLGIVFLFQQEYMQIRVKDTYQVLVGEKPLDPSTINISSYALLVNFNIVKEGTIDNNFLGAGIGNYENIYDKYIHNYPSLPWGEGVPGRGDATSLLLKVTSEFGIIGLIFLVVFLFKNLRFRGNEEILIINHAAMITILIIFIRMGSYYINGIPFIALIYILSKNYQKQLR